jgi:rubrerythrin
MRFKFDEDPCYKCGADAKVFNRIRHSTRTEGRGEKYEDGTFENNDYHTFSVYKCGNCGTEVEMLD